MANGLFHVRLRVLVAALEEALKVGTRSQYLSHIRF
jgi:hypothetical protein